jgi:hypothetical protein
MEQSVDDYDRAVIERENIVDRLRAMLDRGLVADDAPELVAMVEQIADLRKELRE